MSAPCNHQTAEGILGWAAVGATVAAYDLWALRGHHTTLSSAYATASRHPVGRVVLVAADAVLLAHLWKFPRSAARFDPLGMAARRLSGGSVMEPISDEASPERHEQVATPRWDTKQRCSCGVEFASRAELYHHQAPALRELLTVAESDCDRWWGEARNLRRLVFWLCESDEINIVIGSESGWVTINDEERNIPSEFEKALVVTLDAAGGEAL